MTATPIYQMFDMIAQSGVGNLGDIGLITLQLMISLFFEVKFLFASVKKRPPMVQLSIAMIPIILIATYSIVCGLFFSAFLGNGPTPSEMTELIEVTLSSRSISEMLIVTVVFFALMLVYSIAYKLNLLQWLMTFGMEMLMAFSLLILYGGLRVADFPFTILDLCERNIYLARWPIYGYFTVMFKCFVLAMSLFLGFVLRERKEKPENEEEKYGDRRGFYQKKALKYLTKNDALIGSALLLFGVAALIFTLWRTIQEEGASLSIDLIPAVTMVSALFSAPAIMGVFLICRALWPRTGKAYRQLLAMGNSDTVLRLFCEEVVDGKDPETNLWSGNTKIQTEHFVFNQVGIRTWVEWIGEKPQPDAWTRK